MKRHFLAILTLLTAIVTATDAKVIYVAPQGDDAAAGTIDAPLATLPAAYRLTEGGDTVCFRGGTYNVTDSQVMKIEGVYAFVFALEKAGTAEHRTCYMGYPGERPVFDFSALMLDGKHRFAAFYLGADYVHLRNFDIVGVPVRIKGHTQSECVSARRGSHCIVEDIAMHDGMAIGYYQKRGSHNLVVDCDAYNNYDDYSEGPYGGNVDGFGCHVFDTFEVGNVFRRCRAWRNSDDGFDLISCAAPVEIDHCMAFYNGYCPSSNPADTVNFVSAGDGNGFKAGGWGMNKRKTKCPDVCPSHYIHHSLAYRNKAHGFYANHHLAGNTWENNTSCGNRSNYNMLNRKNTFEAIDVPGYDHSLANNVSWTFTDASLGGHLINIDPDRVTLTNNSFAPSVSSVEVTAEMFVSTSVSLLFTRRLPDGRLPSIDFLRGKAGTILEERQMGW
ncbi:MAG: right-handed parallel beta-helix repeat-containing protein [Prevotella sp.]|nr:right-handed parallel beta-helix repeat-containing protein [Prevotella sp.]